LPTNELQIQNHTIEAIRRLPADRQDELAQAILEASKPSPNGYSAEQLAAIDEGISDADGFISDQDLEQIFCSLPSCMRLRLTSRAARDLTGIADYIEQENPAAARRVVQRTERTLRLIQRSPLIGRQSARPHTHEFPPRLAI